MNRQYKLKRPIPLLPTPPTAMSELFGFDAYAPREVAQRVENVGVAKARMATLPLCLLGVLAGAFIGFGSLLFALVMMPLPLLQMFAAHAAAANATHAAIVKDG